jgi:hypothetical protein
MSTKEQVDAALAYAKLRREAERKKLSLYMLPYFDALCEILNDTFWAPYSSQRSLKEQAELFAKGRTKESIAKGEGIVTNAQAGDSPHNWGCATDWAEFRPEFRGQDIWNRANWNQFRDAVLHVGMKWGGHFTAVRDGKVVPFPDNPHCELPISVKWSQVGDMYRKSGVERAVEFIGLNITNGGAKK